MKFDLAEIVATISPSPLSIELEIEELRKAYPELNNSELSRKYSKRIVNKYTSIGASSALPSMMPGLGTAAQVATELGTISGDLVLMLRWMATICYGVGIINGKDMSQDLNRDFIGVLGRWCGAIIALKEATTRLGSKVALVQFNKNVSGKVLQKINQRVGTTILTKYGTKRGGIALGKLIPFGVGVAVGGTFNYYTMKKFSKAAQTYYESDDYTDFVIVE